MKVSGLRFTPSDLLRMERIILDKLKWNLNATTPLYFLEVVSTKLIICNIFCSLTYVLKFERVKVIINYCCFQVQGRVMFFANVGRVAFMYLNRFNYRV